MKIALVGTALTSTQLAPCHDPSWEIWACSPGMMNLLPRIDKFFEMHPMAPLGRDSEYALYLAWVKGQKDVYLLQEDARFPTAKRYPIEEMLERWDPAFFASSVAYMMAMAITLKPEAIGIWGADMAANSEYGSQRVPMQIFCWEARRLGIKIYIPPESCLGVPAPLYGYQELDPMHIRMAARNAELTERLRTFEGAKADLDDKITRLKGALDADGYFMRTFPQYDPAKKIPKVP